MASGDRKVAPFATGHLTEDRGAPATLTSAYMITITITSTRRTGFHGLNVLVLVVVLVLAGLDDEDADEHEHELCCAVGGSLH